ncbi:MAG: hypothetical protein WBA39_18175 [Rivularia sp. (in: cyanobacteria)]
MSNNTDLYIHFKNIFIHLKKNQTYIFKITKKLGSFNEGMMKQGKGEEVGEVGEGGGWGDGETRGR